MDKRINSLYSIILVFIVMVLNSCSSSQQQKDSAPPDWAAQPASFKGKELQEYREIQKLYGKGSYDLALARMSRFEKRYPKGSKLAQVQNLHGLIYLKNKNTTQAIERFSLASKNAKDPSFKQHALYNLATAQYEAKQFPASESTLNQINPNELTTKTLVKYYYFKALFDQKNGQHKSASERMFLAAPNLETAQGKEAYRKLLSTSLSQINDMTVLEALYLQNQTNPFADILLLRLGKKSIEQGQRSSAEKYLQESPLYPEAEEAFHKLNTMPAAPLPPVTASASHVGSAGGNIGVLLPMSGRFAEFGARSLQGIELAFRMFNLDKPDSGITLVVEDSGDTPEKTVKAMEKLYYDHKVVAVIGPLLSKGVNEVSQRAQELEIPLISLAQKPVQAGDFVFQFAMSSKQQAYEIARFAIQNASLKKFIIVHPKDAFGQEYSQYFWDAVEELGGKVVGIESYYPGDTDFRQIVDKLSGLYFKDDRAREQIALDKARENDKITKRNRKTEHYFKLPPVVDYDAVFIPDEANVVSQIIPTFAYRDVENVKFLGIATWNSPNLIKRAGNYAENALFVDCFYSGALDAKTLEFIPLYSKTFESEPASMEAIAYDAALLLEHTLLLSGSATSDINRTELRDRLKQTKDFDGVTGKINYADGSFVRQLKVLEVKNQKIGEVQKQAGP